MTQRIVDAFECPDRHRSFLDRFRMGPTRDHRPDPRTARRRFVEFSEFAPARFQLLAANCVDCRAPIVKAPPGVWAVRYSDSCEEERKIRTG